MVWRTLDEPDQDSQNALIRYVKVKEQAGIDSLRSILRFSKLVDSKITFYTNDTTGVNGAIVRANCSNINVKCHERKATFVGAELSSSSVLIIEDP